MTLLTHPRFDIVFAHGGSLTHESHTRRDLEAQLTALIAASSRSLTLAEVIVSTRLEEGEGRRIGIEKERSWVRRGGTGGTDGE